jgi:DNA-binding transcriptional LysR family regulator
MRSGRSDAGWVAVRECWAWRGSRDDSFANIVERGFDAGVRLGETVAQDMVSVRRSPPTRTVVVASPDYLARHGTPERPEDLVRHQCINYRQATRGGLYRWEFQRGGEKSGEEFEMAVPAG